MTRATLPAGDRNLLWGRQLLAELHRHGVRDICLAPGSRCAPLTLAAATHPGFRLHQHVDERGLGFFALGLARRSERPVALICTSGTAVANLLPAVVEADLSDVALLLLTADRPPELIDCGANQAIRQQGLFGQHLRASLNLPPADDALSHDWLAAQLEPLLTDLHTTPGPVQINCMLREPLYPSAEALAQPPLASHLSPPAKQQAATAPRHVGWEQWRHCPGLVVAGRLTPSEGAAVASWAEALGWPLLADPQSHARHGATAITPAELALADNELATALAAAPLVVRFGDRITGKRLNQWLADHSGGQWQIVAGHGNRDPHNRVRWRVEARADHFVAAHPPGGNNLWLDIAAINQRLAALLPDCGNQAPLNELTAVMTLASELPAEGLLFCGNSLPIRLFDQVARHLPGRFIANRGASGIDGLVATACGAASGHQGAVTIVVGDLSLFHDLNSLALVANLNQPTLLVLLNNGGGNIFDLLPVPDDQLRNQYFRTPIHWQPAALCTAFGLNHQQPTTLGEFVACCRQAWLRPGATLVEVVVGAGLTGQALRQLGEQVGRGQLLGD